MEARTLIVILAGVLIYITAVSLAASITESEDTESQLSSTQVALLEERLREYLVKEEHDLAQLEHQLRSSLDSISMKKRQLEIRKRNPYQCMHTLVQCYV